MSVVSYAGFDVGWIEIFLFSVIMVNGIWNTSVGSTGGVAFATLAATLTPTVAIPVQSVVEGVSGVYRTWKLRRFVNRGFLLQFAFGGLGGLSGLGGFALGYGLLPKLSAQGTTDNVESVMRVIVACFILIATWVPLGRTVSKRDSAPMLIGMATTPMSLFVGGLGASIAASVESRGEDHSMVIATSTAALVYQYAVRLLVFGLVGFSLTNYLPLMIALTIASLLGTWIGQRLLLKADPQKARQVFRVVVTLIAVSMIVRVAI
ncbi:MAG: TSUP family transporter [Acidimicrobiales bacterium]